MEREEGKREREGVGERHRLLVDWKRSSRFLRYPSSSTISFTIPSSLRISVSRAESDSWFAIALYIRVSYPVWGKSWREGDAYL